MEIYLFFLSLAGFLIIIISTCWWALAAISRDDDSREKRVSNAMHPGYIVTIFVFIVIAVLRGAICE